MHPHFCVFLLLLFFLSSLYKAFAMEAGFGEFHLYLRPVHFEFALHKEKADHLPPTFITSLLEDDSCVDRQTELCVSEDIVFFRLNVIKSSNRLGLNIKTSVHKTYKIIQVGNVKCHMICFLFLQSLRSSISNLKPLSSESKEALNLSATVAIFELKCILFKAKDAQQGISTL